MGNTAKDTRTGRISKVRRVHLGRDMPEPLYLQLAAILRGQIQRGELTGRIPSVKTPAQQYRAAAGTAERALAVLGVPVTIGPRAREDTLTGRTVRAAADRTQGRRGPRCVFDVLGAIDEFQRELFIEGTRAGLAAARARGRKPKLTARQSGTVRRIYEAADPDGRPQHTVAEIAEAVGVHRTTVYDYLSREG